MSLSSRILSASGSVSEIFSFSTEAAYIVSRAAIEVNLTDYLKEKEVDINGIEGITLNLSLKGEWNLGSNVNPYEEEDNSQFQIMVAKGTWNIESNWEFDLQSPSFDEFNDTSKAFRNNGMDWRQVDGLNGPYQLNTQNPNPTNKYNSAYTYKVDINGHLFEEIKEDMAQAEFNNLACILKLVLLDRSQYTYTPPRFTGDNYQGKRIVLLTADSSIDIITKSPNRGNEANNLNGADSSEIRAVGTSSDEVISLSHNVLVNANSVIETDDRVYDTIFLGGNAINGGVSFENSQQADDFVAELGTIGNPVPGLWASGAGISDLYDYTIIGNPDNLVEGGNVTETTNISSDLYPAMYGWRPGARNTASSGTGPPTFSTPSGGRFIYTECTARPHGLFRLQTPNIDITSVTPGTLNLEFFIHMYSSLSSAMGRFFVDVTTITGGTHLLQNGTIDQWESMPMNAFTEDSVASGTSYYDSIERLSLGLEDLSHETISGDTYGFNFIEGEDFTGRISDNANQWTRVIIPLDKFISEDPNSSRIIRIQFRSYTRPRSNSSGSATYSGYCLAPQGSNICVYDLPQTYCVTNATSSFVCNNNGGEWFPVEGNRSGYKAQNYWKGDIAIDMVKVTGSLIDSSAYNSVVRGTVSATYTGSIIEGEGTNFEEDLVVGQLIKIESNQDLYAAPLNKYEYFQVDTIYSPTRFVVSGFSIGDGNSSDTYEGPSASGLKMWGGPMPPPTAPDETDLPYWKMWDEGFNEWGPIGSQSCAQLCGQAGCTSGCPELGNSFELNGVGDDEAGIQTSGRVWRGNIGYNWNDCAYTNSNNPRVVYCCCNDPSAPPPGPDEEDTLE